MEYSFFKNEAGRASVLDELKSITADDNDSGKSYWLHLDRVRKYTFLQLRGKLLRKLQGRNPYKVHELRFSLPSKIARTFCVIDRSSVLWLLHLVIKKREETKRSDIELAEQRAKVLNQQIHYL